jgi:RimJ/RimL family protein N-acetyltransferase
MRAPPYLATARLRLRPRRRDDINAILEMDLDPEVYRYSEMLPSIPKTPDPATLRETIKSQIKSGLPRDSWVVEWKDQPGLLGLAGLGSASIGMEANVLWFRLVRSAWGQGIASEAVHAILDYGFRVLKHPTIVAFSHMENWRSCRLLEKIGMENVGIAVVEQRSILSAPRSSALVRGGNILNIRCSAGIKYMNYRLERRAYLDRGRSPLATTSTK